MESFFGIGIPELVLILLIAGIVMGPERIGVAARWLGRTSAQLQSISRGFLRQLNAELDGIQDSEEIQGTIRDMQELRSQLDQLKKELVSVTNGAVREGQHSIEQIQEDLERTIAPPGSKALPSRATSPADEPSLSGDLPKRLEIPDDPEL